MGGRPAVAYSLRFVSLSPNSDINVGRGVDPRPPCKWALVLTVHLMSVRSILRQLIGEIERAWVWRREFVPSRVERQRRQMGSHRGNLIAGAATSDRQSGRPAFRKPSA